MNFSKEHEKLTEVLDILSSGSNILSPRKMKAREYVAKALAELEAEHFAAIKEADLKG